MRLLLTLLRRSWLGNQKELPSRAATGGLSHRGDILGRASAVARQLSLPPNMSVVAKEGGYCPCSGLQTSLRRGEPAGGGQTLLQ
jgi:hypothetical protein